MGDLFLLVPHPHFDVAPVGDGYRVGIKSVGCTVLAGSGRIDTENAVSDNGQVSAFR